MPSYSGVWTLTAVYQAVGAGNWPDATAPIGLFGGGGAGGITNSIDKIIITTTGNATDFGDLTQAREYLGGCSSSVRGVFAGGELDPGIGLNSNVIDYVTIATVGNATDFGDLTAVTGFISGCSSSTRGLFGGGNAGGVTSAISYITIASTGNSTTFGNLTVARQSLAACSSNTRGVFGGGDTSGGLTGTNVIDYVTIASTGNATDFGDLIAAKSNNVGCSSSTRGLFAGGYINTNVIQYITIATTGNATDFGDLLNALYDYGACASTTRGVFAGGYVTNVIQYVTIATTGDATDFGDLPYSYKFALAGCSNAHGGL